MRPLPKIVLTLCAGFLLAFLLRTVLPSDWGVDFRYGGAYHMVPLNRMVFWLCCSVAIIVALVLAIKRVA